MLPRSVQAAAARTIRSFSDAVNTRLLLGVVDFRQKRHLRSLEP
jgi:hypothetical protein